MRARNILLACLASALAAAPLRAQAGAGAGAAPPDGQRTAQSSQNQTDQPPAVTSCPCCGATVPAGPRGRAAAAPRAPANQGGTAPANARAQARGPGRGQGRGPGRGRGFGPGGGQGLGPAAARGTGRGMGMGRGLGPCRAAPPTGGDQGTTAPAAEMSYLQRLQGTLGSELFARDYYQAAALALPGVPRYQNLGGAEQNHANAISAALIRLGAVPVSAHGLPIVPPKTVAEADAEGRKIEEHVIGVYDGLIRDCTDPQLAVVLQNIQAANFRHLRAVGG